jgi:hypothetical protein
MTPVPPLSISGREEGTGSGRVDGTGSVASEGCECTCTVSNVQQWSVPTQTRCMTIREARAKFPKALQAGEPLASDGPIMQATARIGITRFVFAKAGQSSEPPL